MLKKNEEFALFEKGTIGGFQLLIAKDLDVFEWEKLEVETGRLYYTEIYKRTNKIGPNGQAIFKFSERIF